MFVVIETSAIKADNGQCKHRMEKHFLIWKIRNLLQTQKIFLNKHFIVKIHYFKYSIKYLAWKVRKKVAIKEWVHSCLLWIRKPDTFNSHTDGLKHNTVRESLITISLTEQTGTGLYEVGQWEKRSCHWFNFGPIWCFCLIIMILRNDNITIERADVW